MGKGPEKYKRGDRKGLLRTRKRGSHHWVDKAGDPLTFTLFPMIEDLESIYVTEQEIRERVEVLGKEITQAYHEADELTVIAIINGALLFTADLLRHIDMPVRVDCMRVSSYRNDVDPVQEPEIIDMLRLDLRDRHVLIIDDILDTGHTCKRVIREIKRLRPASVRFAALLEKEGRREVDVEPDFIGFQIPDEFVVGYGLDFAEHYRQLPCIGVLKPELQNPPSWV
ncbi:MAG: hypoxanthine phosphoribosyltransferase [Oceanipulchritudo sp.]